MCAEERDIELLAQEELQQSRKEMDHIKVTLD